MTFSPDNTSIEDALARERSKVLQRFAADPFLGYSTFDEAVADAKYSSQAEALAWLFSGKNVFLSGPAGSGKTFLLERFKEWLDAEYEGRINMAITASTGIAAQLLGGKTIHSWSGIGINTEKFKQPTKTEWSAADRIKSTDVLVIDEISMLPAYLFTRLDALLRYMRRSKAPFGGIQLIVMGDFMQLPPVSKKGERTADGELLDSGFCIKTDAWKSAGFRALYLDKVRRAKDPKLKRVLASIAADKVDDRTRDLVESRLGEPKDPAKKYMTLFTTNKNVDRYNDEKLAENPNREIRLPIQYHLDSRHWDALKKSHGIPEFCKVKIGATVMLTANLPDGHSNGSLGEVVDISSEGCTVLFNDGISEFIGYKDYNHIDKKLIRTEIRRGKEFEIFDEVIVSTVSAVPMKLGYAISVHKSQGQTFSAVEVDLSFIFSAGLGYVALSRVGGLDDLVITGGRIHPDTYRVDQNSLRYARATRKAAATRRAEMLKNIEDTKLHFAKLEDAKPAEELEAIVDTAEDVIDVFAVGADGDGERSPISISIDEEHQDFIPPTKRLAAPAFLSFEQLLVNPQARAEIWEPRVDNRRMRMEREARRSGF